MIRLMDNREMSTDITADERNYYKAKTSYKEKLWLLEVVLSSHDSDAL